MISILLGRHMLYRQVKLRRVQTMLSTCMFHWYRNASKCYVYLADVSASASSDQSHASQSGNRAFRDSRMVHRGWTLHRNLSLQPRSSFLKEGVRLENRTSLENYIHDRTGIPISALRGSALSGLQRCSATGMDGGPENDKRRRQGILATWYFSDPDAD